MSYRRRSGKLTIGAVLCIVAGAFGLISGIIVAATGGWGVAVGISGTSAAVALGVISIIFGVIALVGGIRALEQRSFWLAIAGGLCALMSSWILGIPALICIGLSRPEFR